MALNNNIDIKLTKTNDYWDIFLDNSGDLEGVNSIDTAIDISLFTDKRADKSEIQASELRRGWIGNLFNAIIDYKIGSKLWLIYQARNLQLTANKGVDFIKDSLKWLIEDGLVEDIKVSANRTIDNIEFNLRIIRKDNEIERIFILWENSQWL